MFTGLVEDVGTIRSASSEGFGRRFAIRTALPDTGFAAGDSVAVDGVCLTLEKRPSGQVFEVVASQETLACSTAPSWQSGRRVHLERALRLGDRLGGHLVQGHVDGRGVVERVVPAGESVILHVSVPRDLARYLARKGSVAIDGVSLTVNELAGQEIRVNIVPFTWRRTRFPELRQGDAVNVEVDLLARYIERLATPEGEADGSGGLGLGRLLENGF
jgi:riboflavin synthase